MYRERIHEPPDERASGAGGADRTGASDAGGGGAAARGRTYHESPPPPSPAPPRPQAYTHRILVLHSAPGIPLRGTAGGSRHLQEWIRGLLAEGHAVSVLCRRLGQAEATSAFEPSCPIEAVGAPSLASPLRRRPRIDETLYDLAFLRAARAHAHRFRPTLIYERMSLYGQAGGRLARQLGIPLLLEVNAPLVRERNEFEGLRAGARERRLEGRILRRASRILVVSQALARHVEARGVPACRIDVLPNGVDPDRFQPHPPDPTLRRTMGLGPGPVIGFQGSFKPWHGADLLLEAFAALPARTMDAPPRLLFIGDGPQLPALRRRAAALHLGDRVAFAGAVGPELLPRLQAMCSIATAPAPFRDDYWFCPLKIPEAMAQSIPVLASDQESHRAYLGPQDGRSAGVLLASQRPRDWTAALDRLLDDEQGRRLLGAEGRRRSLGPLRWQSLVRRALRFFPGPAVADDARPAPYTSPRTVASDGVE